MLLCLDSNPQPTELHHHILLEKDWKELTTRRNILEINKFCAVLLVYEKRNIEYKCNIKGGKKAPASLLELGSGHI
uniref:Uncharacterized protein n=1 Tax=Arion vulgaris TaxID=1028688 RepID=A0A0B6ZKV3_9EUPU